MEQIFESTFWTELYKNGQNWLIEELPGLLIVLVLFFLTLKIVGFSFKKLNKTFLKRADRNEKTDIVEEGKELIP